VTTVKQLNWNYAEWTERGKRLSHFTGIVQSNATVDRFILYSRV